MHPVKSAVSVATLLIGFVLNAFLYEAAGAQTHQSAYERALQEMQPATGDGRHSLIGTVLSLEPANLDLQARLRSAIQSGSIILAGEVHDNPHAHSLRAALLRDLADRQPLRPALVFEHIKSDQQIGLDLFYEFHAKARRLGHAQDLFRFLEWDRSGWPDKRLFEPLFSAAIFAGFPILPGDVPRERMRTIARGGLTALTDNERQLYKLDEPLDPPLQDALLDELEASHCGLMPKSAFTGMAVAQRYRDAHLAEALSKAADLHGSAILFAGNGHVRRDRGVPHYLKDMAAQRPVFAVMFLEVEDGKTDAEAYVPRDPQGKPAVDYIILVPRTDRKDPCVEMRERFAKPK